MKAPKFWMMVPALLVAGVVSVAYAKLPAPNPTNEQKAAAAAKKEKDQAAAKKQAESLAKSQDRVADRYKREKGAMKTAAPAMKK